MKILILHALAILITSGSALGQGTFVNLDFEASSLPTNLYTGVAVVDALPGWSVYRGNVQKTQIAYNLYTPGSAIGFFANTGYFRQLSGDYAVFFQTDSRDPVDVALVQTGQMPADAKFVQFKTVFPFTPGDLILSFANTTLSLQPLGTFPSYTMWGADVSGFAGTSGELRFTGTAANGGANILMDDIVFSVDPVPEPSIWALLVLGAAVLFWSKGRRR